MSLRVHTRGLSTAILLAASVALTLTACGSSTSASSSAPTTPAQRGAAPATTKPAPTVIAPCYSASDIAADGVLLDIPATDFRQAEKISAIVTGTGDTGVVLAHQAGSNLCQWKSGQKELTDAGYRVIAISMLKYDDADVAAAAAELRKRGAKHIILMGASRGGTAALAGAALVDPPADGVVSLSGPGTSDTGIIASSLVPNLKVPILFAVGDSDAPFNDEVKGMYATAKPGTATLVVGKDTSLHGVSLYGNDATVHQAVLAFLKQHSA